jgi:hypothetical protein
MRTSLLPCRHRRDGRKHPAAALDDHRSDRSRAERPLPAHGMRRDDLRRRAYRRERLQGRDHLHRIGSPLLKIRAEFDPVTRRRCYHRAADEQCRPPIRARAVGNPGVPAARCDSLADVRRMGAGGLIRPRRIRLRRVWRLRRIRLRRRIGLLRIGRAVRVLRRRIGIAVWIARRISLARGENQRGSGCYDKPFHVINNGRAGRRVPYSGSVTVARACRASPVT